MIRFVLNLYIFIIFLDTILSYIPSLYQTSWAKQIKKLADITLNPIRKILPQDLAFDISPLIVFFILRLIMSLW